MQTPAINENCTGCGRCVATRQLQALSLETELPNGFGRKKVVLDPRLCTGCPDCIPSCPHQVLSLDGH